MIKRLRCVDACLTPAEHTVGLLCGLQDMNAPMWQQPHTSRMTRLPFGMLKVGTQRLPSERCAMSPTSSPVSLRRTSCNWSSALHRAR
jgi:hypothetical protein